MYLRCVGVAGAVLGTEVQSELGSRLLYLAWLYLAMVVLQSAAFPAPYGKFSSSRQWRVVATLCSAVVPAWLAWMLMELPSLVLAVSAQLHLLHNGQPGGAVLLLPFSGNPCSTLTAHITNHFNVSAVHYLNRSLVFPLLKLCSPVPGRPYPVLTAAAAALFTAGNGLLQSQAVVTNPAPAPALLTLLGLALFLAGMAVNIQSDRILAGLRRETGPEYGVPQGSLFQLVSCPHYLGEIIEW